jgi:hypothetical protein
VFRASSIDSYMVLTAVAAVALPPKFDFDSVGAVLKQAEWLLC